MQSNAETTTTNTPADANNDCVGPASKAAGKASACDGCPNQKSCATGKHSSPSALAARNEEHASIRDSLSNVANVLLVLSGKGGVGKSTTCCQIAHTLASRGYSVGVLDVDICGPSAARMLGTDGREVHRSGSGWTPVYAAPNLAVMSVSFLLPDSDAAVVWRGPRKNGMIKQFLTETCWDDEGLDYLLIDTPPGTSDEHISTVQYLQGALGGDGDGKTFDWGGALIVTTPEEVSMADVRKELNFCVKTKLPVVGVVENMSGLRTRVRDMKFASSTIGGDIGSDRTDEILALLNERCPEVLDILAVTDVFPTSGDGPRGMAHRYDVPYLGTLPLDPNLLRACEDGVCFVDDFPGSPAVNPINSLVDKILHALPVMEEEELSMEEEDLSMKE